jgi:hypothetical protein
MDDIEGQNLQHQDPIVIIVLKQCVVRLFIAQGHLRISEPCMDCEPVVKNRHQIFSGKFIFLLSD